MTKHLFKLVWNRKRLNLRIAMEIFISFIVLFSVVAIAMYYLDNYRKPLGFSFENVWIVTFDTKIDLNENYLVVFPELREKYAQVELAIRDLPQVISLAGGDNIPYSNTERSNRYEAGAERFYFEFHEVGDGFKDAMGLRQMRGRWFEAADDGVNWRPAVVNEMFAQQAFGNGNPLGKKIKVSFDQKEVRIVGVIKEYRKRGEFAEPLPVAFYRASMSKTNVTPFHFNFIAVKVHEGTARAFEEKLMAVLTDTAPEWSFEIHTLSDIREKQLRSRLNLILIWALISGFLMLMVGLGLLGVLWQSVTQRTKEIGLRRAQGATAASIYRQILGEIFIITSMGLAAGLLVVVQFPLLNLFGFLSGKVIIISIAVSTALIYLLTSLCGLYPGRLAAEVHPAEALHYE
jgi:putative ABC transport system permease protein